MAKIEELSQILANQIAAGEVVERPASVVKELIENAIDANSTQIDVFIEEAGLKKIQVIDNGDGIDADDVLNAFKRHATSKIHSRDDLFRIRSLGFRGEALPSIASVSQVTLETSTGLEGSYVYLEGGEVKEHRPHSLRKGTSLTVENLFFNTPARLKYVKSLQTELANISDIVNRLAMSHTTIAFRLIHDGNQLLKTMGSGDLKQTIAGIYGVSTAKKMLSIEGGDLDFKVTGYISLPEVTRAGRHYLSVIINGRYIKNFLLNKSIVAGYGSKLMVGRFPIAVIQITMDPLLVDVNVHPTKQEVRLSKEPELMALITDVIQSRLGEESLIPRVTDTAPFQKQLKTKDDTTQLSLNMVADKKGSRQQTDLAYDASTGTFYVEKKERVTESTPVWQTKEDMIVRSEVGNDSTTVSKEDYHENIVKNQDVSQVEEEKEAKRDHFDFPSLEYFGQMHGTYLFAQNETGLYIIDQHAAQERVKYEYYREKIGQVGEDHQELLVPIVLDFGTDEVLRLRERMSALEEVGIYLEVFGQNSFIVRSHPTWYPQGEEETIIKDMVGLCLETGKVNVTEYREKTAIMMSCKRSIKANHYLNDSQARALLEELKACENPYNCPHGRPVLIHFTNTDMEKLFKRIQESH